VRYPHPNSMQYLRSLFMHISLKEISSNIIAHLPHSITRLQLIQQYKQAVWEQGNHVYDIIVDNIHYQL